MTLEKIFSIELSLERCKECGLCIAFCPRKVLVAGENDKPAVANQERCSGCNLCEYRCPDFAIKVTEGGVEIGVL